MVEFVKENEIEQVQSVQKTDCFGSFIRLCLGMSIHEQWMISLIARPAKASTGKDVSKNRTLFVYYI